MKRLLSVCLFSGAMLAGAALSPAGQLFDSLEQFLLANPTNAWEVSAYALRNLSASAPAVARGAGAGARLGYWLKPGLGAALDLSYCDNSWTFASMALAGRGTVPVGPAQLNLYVYAGPGWNIRSDLQRSVVAVAGCGAALGVRKWPAWALFAEYATVQTQREQNRLLIGLTRRF